MSDQEVLDAKTKIITYLELQIMLQEKINIIEKELEQWNK